MTGSEETGAVRQADNFTAAGFADVGFAAAKINLMLHLRGRRPDGYHDLESLVSFASIGDHLTLMPGDHAPLQVTGPMAAALANTGGTGVDNLVNHARTALAQHLPDLPEGGFILEKNLPIASGIGGGSADAAAALRLLADHAGIAADHPALLDAAAAIGADIPVCLAGRSRVMRGTGTDLGPPLTLPKWPALLVNPGIATPTPEIFRRLGLAPGDPFRPAAATDRALPSEPHDWPAPDDRSGWLARLMGGRNDLAAPAEAFVPEIAAIRAALAGCTGCLLARMSGSGATVFALFADPDTRDDAGALMRSRHPDYWIAATTIGG